MAAVALAGAVAVHALGTATPFPLLPDAQAAQDAAVETALRDTLQRYATALESLDADAVKKVHPSIPVESLAKAFKDMRELTVEIDAIRLLSVESATARVSCRVTQTLTPRAGARQTTAVTRVVRLRRSSGSWVIETFER
jgi:hypothetical protein